MTGIVPDALIEAVLAFDLGRFAECPSFAAVCDQLEVVMETVSRSGLTSPSHVTNAHL